MGAGRAAVTQRSPYPSRASGVYPAVVHERLLGLPQEVCVSVPRIGDWEGVGTDRSRTQKSAEGIVPGDDQGRPERQEL